ncbi:hypothetical protein AGLY_017206 [Aphis glycines]|uniref:Uncharacterized protein n=1 Tax=Aphis glycines TaxID=307491 RepID=A0A6G0SWA6_APHGL|nr:hypothetical protein AGLY_017206 [Aphis glycines]
MVYENTITGEIRDVSFKTFNVACFLTSNLTALLKNMYDKLLNEQKTFTLKGSSWRQISLDGLQLRINKKKSGLNFNCINYPTPINQIKKFEKINNVSVNVYSCDDKNQIYPLHVSNKEKSDHFDFNKPNKNKPWGQHALDSHKVICQKHKLCKPVMIEPRDDEFIQFKNFNRADRIPIIIFTPSN